MFRKIFTLSLALIFMTILGYCQTADSISAPKVVPLSPNAAEFAKYGNIPMSNSTGVPSISIPLYEINTGKIKVPISLSHHASGIKVTQKATWIGLGWSLNAGGVISRGVRGLHDEEPTYGWMNEQGTSATIHSKLISGQQNYADLDEVRKYQEDTYDSAPDFFSYNMPSLSGRFVYMQSVSAFKPIPLEPIKIQHLTAIGNPTLDNSYQITDVDGTNYYFQDKQSHYQDIKKPTDHANQSPTEHEVQSWYLSKIISADSKDTVQFNYTTVTTVGGTNEDFEETEVHHYSTNYGANGTDAYGNQEVKMNQSWYYDSYIVLKEILFRQGKVTFYGNTPRRDYLGCMLDSVTVFNKNGQQYNPIYKYVLNHDYFTTAQPQFDTWDYRLRLLSLSKIPLIANNTSETHQFVYDTTPLPSIHDKSVDYWGYYNGVSQNSFLPAVLPSAPELNRLYAQTNQKIGVANRNESDTYIQAGILKKIIYPTKGSTVFNYESHKYTSDQTQTQTVSVVQTSLTGIGKRNVTTKNTNFNWPTGTTTSVGPVTINFTAHTNPSSFDAAQRATLTDLTTNTVMGIWEHQGDFTKPYVATSAFTFDSTHQYQVTLVVDDDAPTNISFSLTAQVTNTTSVVKNGGGLRIASIQNYDHTGVVLSTDKYTYSGESIGKNDNLVAGNYVKSNSVLGYFIGLLCSEKYRDHIYYYAAPAYSGQSFEGANVLYSQVTKTSYDNNNNANGKTEYSYNLYGAFNSIYSPSMPGGREYVDQSMGVAALPLSEVHYRRNLDGTYSKLKDKAYGYGGAGYFSDGVTRIIRNVIIDDPSTNCHLLHPGDFTLYDYSLSTGARKLTAVRETDYNEADSAIITITTYDYTNPSHMQVTKTTTTSSDGKTLIAQNKYPADYTDATYGTDLLRSQSINNKLVEQIVTRDGNTEKQVATSYKIFQGSVLPNLVSMAISGGALEPRLKYNNYDTQSNVTEVAKVGAPLTSYKWAYNNAYPIAQVVNASSAEFYYEGNEESTAAGVTTGAAHTGNKYSTIALVSWTKPNSRSYVISYWYLSGGIWKYSGEQAYTSTSFTMTPSTGYDDVRIYPSDAQMTTYTYAPLVGMTSAIDAKGMTTTYEYDNLQRLMNVRDKDGYIVKHTDYHYQGQ
jgi:hypothetical protein